MKNLYKYASILCLLSMGSCALEPMEIPEEELYLRAFIKKFGLIDPTQTWNMATSACVTVIPESHASSVKVYGKCNDKYYIVAEIKNVSQKVTIPIDIPTTVNDLKVVVDGEAYFTSPGGTVTANKTKSRSYVYNGQGYSVGTLNPSTGLVDPTWINHRADISIDDNGQRKYFKVSDVKKLFDILPEGADDRYNQSYPGNLFEPGIKTDFLLSGKGKTITVYPIYWNSCQEHELGIYYTPDNGDITSANIVRVPFYKMHKPPQFEHLDFKAVYDATGATNMVTNGKATDTNNGDYQFKNSSDDADYGGTDGAKTNCRVYNFGSGSEAFSAWGARASAPSDASNYYESQFYIKLANDATFEKGKSYRMTFKCRADEAGTENTDFGFELQTATGAYYEQHYSDASFNITSQWETVTLYFTVGTSGATETAPSVVCISLNSYPHWMSYFFTDIEITEAKYKWERATSFWTSDPELKAVKSYKSVYDNPFTWNWNFFNPNNIPGVAVGGSALTQADGYRHVDYSTNNIPPRDIKDQKGTQDEYEAKYAYRDMQNAHLLMSNSDGGPLLTPLPDTDMLGRVYAYDKDADDDMYVASKGINIFIPEGLRYGFYIHFKDIMYPYDELYVYSEVDGNIDYMHRKNQSNNSHFVGGKSLDKNDPQDRKYATFCAMFEQQINPNLSYTYLTFEDWIIHSDTNTKYNGDYDLNDLAFLIENVNIEEDIEERPDEFDYLICAEDLGSKDDFDFNDMIVGLNILTQGEGDDPSKYYKKVTFTALAAGGTLPLHLCYGGNTWDPATGTVIVNSQPIVLHPDGEPESSEWHKWFGIDDYTKIINTSNGARYQAGKLCTINVPTSFNLENFGKIRDHGGDKSINGIFIKVQQSDGTFTDAYDPADGMVVPSPEVGQAPQMFLILDRCRANGELRNWIWASERTPIYYVYPDFLNWAKSSSSVTTYNEWYMSPEDPVEIIYSLYGKRPKRYMSGD